ncbi:MAG: protein kinase [Planctomycetia bacterium]|nr:protein kinase [Planctomycetia bacterium]
MPMRAQPQLEPIPGYKLIERLGGGGFGEVWKAEAPGGILKAIKFVFGTLHGATEEEGGAQQELKSLNRVKSVRHPYILSLERYDIVDGQLLIVMELADRNLWDRFQECRKQSLPGIPRDELLRYMEEAAEALDLMNMQYGLQHLDIKPQNLFLVHNHLKVADFGLVKDLEGMNTQVTGGVTAVYAAPETFDGIVSRYCDQYNLAIVYQELLCGERPFAGTNVRQLLMQHLTAPPNLKGLPECDQPIIGRSLSKKPDDRYPSCMDMVQALKRAGLGLSLLKQDSKPIDATPPPAPKPVAAPMPTSTTMPPAAPPAQTMVSPIPAVPPGSMTMPPGSMTMPPGSMTMSLSVSMLRKDMPIPPRQEITGDGLLMPALVIGVGGLGLKVLRQLRRGLTERCGPPAMIPHIQLLYLETDPEALGEALGGAPDSALAENEIVLAKLNKPSHYLRPTRGRLAPIDPWMHMGMLCRVPRNQVTTEGLRLLGRLAYADNYRGIASKVKSDLAALANPNALTAADRQTRLGVRTSRPRVYIVNSLCGGTGSGMFIDLAYTVRRQLGKIGVTDLDVVGVFLVPAADRNARKNPALVNAFASLIELNHFSTPEITYSATFDEADEGYVDPAAPFSRSIMVPLPEPSPDPKPTDDAAAWAADFICRDLVAPLGRAVDEARAKLDPAGGGEMICQTFGANLFSTPRRALLDQVGKALTRQLMQSWLQGDRTLQKAVRARLTELLEREELNPESMIAALQSACTSAVGKAPEHAFSKIVNQGFSGTNADVSAVPKVMDQLHQIIGEPQEEDGEAPSTPMIEALDTATANLRKDWEQKFATLVRGMLDDPRFRLAGAEEAAVQLSSMLKEVVQQHQPLLQELLDRAGEAYGTIDELTQTLQKGSWWPGRTNKVAQDLKEALETYPKTRYQGLVLECLLEAYQHIIDKLPKRLEDLKFCRQRLSELQRSLEDRPLPGRGPQTPSINLGPGRHFLPGDALSVEDAIESLARQVRPESMLELDEKVQVSIKRQFKSLLAVCLAANEMFKDLPGIIRQEAEAHVESLLGTGSVAATYLDHQGTEQEVSADLAAAFEAATPVLPGLRSSSPELTFLVLPKDEAGKELGQLARSVFGEVQVIEAEGANDIYFYRERSQVPLPDLPQLGLAAEEAYKQMTASGQYTPHSRNDVTEWKSAT